MNSCAAPFPQPTFPTRTRRSTKMGGFVATYVARFNAQNSSTRCKAVRVLIAARKARLRNTCDAHRMAESTFSCEAEYKALFFPFAAKTAKKISRMYPLPTPNFAAIRAVLWWIFFLVLSVGRRRRGALKSDMCWENLGLVSLPLFRR